VWDKIGGGVLEFDGLKLCLKARFSFLWDVNSWFENRCCLIWLGVRPQTFEIIQHLLSSGQIRDLQVAHNVCQKLWAEKVADQA